MDHPAALHRLEVGVPATVEHSSEAGPETAKWVAETTQAGSLSLILDSPLTRSSEFYHLYGCLEAADEGQGPASPYTAASCHWIRSV